MKIVGHLFFLAYLAFSWYYADERVFFADSAVHLFRIVNTETFNIEAHRYSTVFAQFLPLAFIKAGASLHAVVKVFSFSYVLLYYVVFLICVYVYKNMAAAWLLILSHILAIRLSIYHTVTETHQALVYCSLFYAWIKHHNTIIIPGVWHRIQQILIGSLILGIAFWAHPVAIITLFVVYVWSIHKKRTLVGFAKDTVVLAAILPLLLYKVTIATTSYESGFVSQIMEIPQLLPHFNHLFSKWFFEYHFKHLYRPTLIVFIVSTLYLLWEKKWFSAVLYQVMVFGGLLFL